jgi:hypothetical protein
MQASPSGILIRPETLSAPAVWQSGRVIDALHLGGGRLLVGSDTGGLWVAQPNGDGRPVSDDWNFPNVRCLERRRGFQDAILCGTEGALMSNLPNLDPEAAWVALNLPDGVNTVYRIASLDSSRTVIATNNGIWWAEHGNPFQVIGWRQALWRKMTGELVPLSGAWTGLARSGSLEVAAGSAGDSPADIIFSLHGITRHYHPILFGQFEENELVFLTPVIPEVSDDDFTKMLFVSIGSCDQFPNNVYAATFYNVDEPRKHAGLFHLLRSWDKGRSWHLMSKNLVAPPADAKGDLDSLTGEYKNGGPIKTISVHPTNAGRIAISGYLSSISDDFGVSWLPLGGSWTPDPAGGSVFSFVPGSPLHVDHHRLVFAPDAGHPERIVVCTDGGVFTADDWRNANSFGSIHNKPLRTLQFLSSAAYHRLNVNRTFLGSIGSTSLTRGLVAGGLQDNGNVWKPDHVRGIWQQQENGDGGFDVAFGADRFVHKIADPDGEGDEDESSNPTAQISELLGNGNLGNPTDVPVVDADGNTVSSKLEAHFEPVQHPTFREGSGRLLHVVGWKDTEVFGLFAEDDGANPFWRSLGSLGDSADSVFTVACNDGSEVLIATVSNKIFRLDSANGDVASMVLSDSLNIIVGGNPTKPTVNRIVATGPGQAFAAFIDPLQAGPVIARRNGDVWERTASSPGDPLVLNRGVAFGMDADDNDPVSDPLVLVATESRVWASNNLGDRWFDVSAGLPAQPHCADLRFNRFKRRWLLSTWGRAVWQGGKLVQVGVSSLLQSDFLKGADHHNFEALILIGEELFHYSKDNGNPQNRWVRTALLTDRATAPACIIRSDYLTDAEHKNFEALVLEGNQLTHFARDNDANGWPWRRVGTIPERVTGPASMIQSDYYEQEGHGNFEALIPTDNGLTHWCRHNGNGQWKRVAVLSTVKGSVGCITTSDYVNDPGHRAFEALIFEPQLHQDTGVLSHAFWNAPLGRWDRTRVLTDLALGPASLLQTDFIRGKKHHNLEAIVWKREGNKSVLRHFHRHDDQGSLNWSEDELISDNAQGPASFIQSDFRPNEDHGNFEVIFAEFDNEVWHRARDQSTGVWMDEGTVT